MNNQEALDSLRHHKKFEEFLNQLNLRKYPGLSLEKIFYFITTGTLVEGMPIESTYKLMRAIKQWLNDSSHGGVRRGAGRPKIHSEIVKITLSAEKDDIEAARAFANHSGSSLQALFRAWLEQLGKTPVRVLER